MSDKMYRTDPNDLLAQSKPKSMARVVPGSFTTEEPPAGGFKAEAAPNITNGKQYRAQVEQQTILRDYRHASRIFVSDSQRLSPKYGFLFYVEFDFNPAITSISNRTAQELGMIVKSVSLPKYTMDTKVHNAYNRVNISQHKIKYDPVTITFHDDQADNVRNFWYDYYSFYFRDSDYADTTYQGISKYQSRPSFDWGYSLRPTVGYNSSTVYQPYQYIQGIRIYSLYQKNFSEYLLVNPTIQQFSHGEHKNGGQDLVEHSMTIQFETVKYLTGYTTANTVGGYIDLHYDNTPSPNLPSADGATQNSIPDGRGGYVDAPDAVTDLAYGMFTNTALYQSQSDLGYTVTLEDKAAQAAALKAGSVTGMVAAAGGGGGFNIPSLGSLTTGLTPGAMLSQQLSAATARLGGIVTSNFSNAVVGGIAKGLGPNGSAIVGGIASAIMNPKAAIQAVENLALNYAINKVTGFVVEKTAPLFSTMSNSIAETVKGWSDSVSKAAGDLWTGAGTALYNATGIQVFSADQLSQQFATNTGIYTPNLFTYTNADGVDITLNTAVTFE